MGRRVNRGAALITAPLYSTAFISSLLTYNVESETDTAWLVSAVGEAVLELQPQQYAAATLSFACVGKACCWEASRRPVRERTWTKLLCHPG